jgi:hypothetical protein
MLPARLSRLLSRRSSTRSRRCRRFPSLRENNLIDEAAEREIRALLATMDGMPGAELWQLESLSMPEWDVLRSRAAVTLASLDRFR